MLKNYKDYPQIKVPSLWPHWSTLHVCKVNHLPGSHLSLCRPHFSRCILSSSCARKAEAILKFHSHLFPLAVLFGQALPYLPSFLYRQLVPGAQSFPGALASFGSVTSIMAKCSRGIRHATHTGDAICPWLSTVTRGDLCQKEKISQ